MTDTFDPPEAAPFESELVRGMRAVLFLDVAESVRIMERHEELFVRSWIGFVDALRASLLPPLGGRIVKSHGDGALLEFASVAQAAQAALRIQALVASLDERMPADARWRLRIGIHLTNVVVSELDLFGAGVNLAARLAALAEPGTVLLSATAREPLVDGVGASMVDRGQHRLKHVAEPVRVYQLGGTAGAALPVRPLEHRPGIGVLPFQRADASAGPPGLGHAIADDLTAALSRSAGWRVISRLSMARCRGYAPDAELAAVLGVPYLVSGSYRSDGTTAAVRIELSDARQNLVLWSERFELQVRELFAGQDRALHEAVRAISRAVLNTEMTRTTSLPFSRLEDYSLHLSAMTLMHRLTPRDLASAARMIDELDERHRRSAEPQAMRSRWHALRMVQGWTDDPVAERQYALDAARRAADRDPTHAFALSMAALLAAQTGDPLLPALGDAQRALTTNPQEPMAGIAFAMLNGYLGDAVQFERHVDEAVALTPLDPALYVYLSMLASSKLSAGKVAEAIDAAASAIRSNASFSTAHLMMTIAQAMAGNEELARQSAANLLSLEPGFRVGSYLAEFSGRRPPGAEDRARALLATGLPP